jgi:hypothetical protein
VTQEPQDVHGSDELYRRIAPAHVNPDGRINSGAFKTRPPEGISVNLARLTTPEETLRPRPTFGIGNLQAAIPTGLGLTVRHAPVPDNHAHSLIEGQNTRAIRRQMAEATALIIQPDDTRVIP